MAARTLRLWLHSPTTVRPHFCQRFLRFFRGFGKLPNKKIPAKLYMSGRDFTEVGTRFLCLLFLTVQQQQKLDQNLTALLTGMEERQTQLEQTLDDLLAQDLFPSPVEEAFPD